LAGSVQQSLRLATRIALRMLRAAFLLLQCIITSPLPIPSPVVLHNKKINVGSYFVLGPFACVKDEVEGFAFENASALAATAPSLAHPIPSELANGGRVHAWDTVRKGTDGSARISFDAVDWNALYHHSAEINQSVLWRRDSTQVSGGRP